MSGRWMRAHAVPPRHGSQSVTVCWAAKGGSGTTVVVAALALTAAPPVLVVDLAGDVSSVLGVDEPAAPGVHDWLRSDAGAEAFAHLSTDVVPGVQLIAAGGERVGPDDARWARLASALRDQPRTVLVDAGTGGPPPELVSGDVRSLLVTRACYLSLRRAARAEHRPSGVVLVEEAGRALRAGDVEAAVGAPVVASIAVDPAVARAVDAGLLAARLPRGVRLDLRDAAA